MSPLMLTADKLEAAALGAAWVASEADPTLSRAARDLINKFSDTIPNELRPVVLDACNRPIKTRSSVDEKFDGAQLRQAIRQRCRLRQTYAEGNGRNTDRMVWPLLIAFLDRTGYLIAWCETRADFRHFKTDRMQDLVVLSENYPGRRAALIKD